MEPSFCGVAGVMVELECVLSGYSDRTSITSISGMALIAATS